jgi:ComEC/Rec2-related protein
LPLNQATPMLKNISKKIKIKFLKFYLKESLDSCKNNFVRNGSESTKHKSDSVLWLAFFFSCGCIFYSKFNNNFLDAIFIFIGFAIIASILFLKNIFTKKSLIYLFILSFLLGSFYNLLYDKIFLNYAKINEKIYVKSEGKIVEIKKFYNPINHQFGANLLIADPVISKIDSTDKIYSKSSKKVKKKISKKKKAGKKTKKNFNKKNSQKNKKTHKKIKKPIDKFNKISATKFRNLINLKNYQEVDRVFLDYQKNYNNLDWLKINNHQQLSKPPPYISVNLVHNNGDIKINDIIKFYAVLQSTKSKDFIDDFDLNLDAKLKKISGYGYVIGDVEIVKRTNPQNHHDFLRELRHKISEKIIKILPNEEGAIALALLIGDQSQISGELLKRIRNCGLAHLLSISGFHLSLACLIFFILFRYLFCSIAMISLRYDLKKISAIFALLASYVYLKIAGSPIPAQRAFLMVCLLLLSYYVQERFNSKRAIMLCLFILTLGNPYLLFNLSFQLSFMAILTMIFYYQDYHQQYSQQELALKKLNENKFFLNRWRNFFSKIFNYFREIIVVSTIIQIITLPYLMHAFHNFSLIAPLTNIFAIPLASFVIMPLGFLALFLMIFNLEYLALHAMKWGIILLEKIIIFFSDFNFSILSTGHLPLISLALSTFAIFLFFLQNQKSTKFLAGIIFVSSFFIGKFIDKPALIFADNQKFYALYHPSQGLRFSKEMRISKRQKNWLVNFNEKQTKTINNCDSKLGSNNFCRICVKNKEVNYCQIFYDDQKILTINQRGKISELCKIYKNYKPNLIVNLTSKYNLPQCFFADKSSTLIIDNFDFLLQKTQLIFIKNNKITRQFANAN